MLLIGTARSLLSPSLQACRRKRSEKHPKEERDVSAKLEMGRGTELIKREWMINIREKANRTLHEPLGTAYNESQQNYSTVDMAS
jgi:hypothetical protein